MNRPWALSKDNPRAKRRLGRRNWLEDEFRLWAFYAAYEQGKDELDLSLRFWNALQRTREDAFVDLRGYRVMRKWKAERLRASRGRSQYGKHQRNIATGRTVAALAIA